jgi:hypothetical protein
LSEVAAETHAVTPSAKPTAAKDPPKLHTPLAAAWPAAPLPEQPKTPGKAPLAGNALVEAAIRKFKVTFVLLDLGARQVSLCGDFNGWSPTATTMKRDEGGHWETTIALAPGRYEYKFMADGHWLPDPLAHENIRNQHGTLNSVVEVRA